MTRLKYILIAIPALFISGLIMPTTVKAQALKDVYKDAFLIGTAISPNITSERSKTLMDTVLKHFNAITIENNLKAAVVNPRPGEYNWGPADQYVAFGEKNKMWIMGHTLVWHQQTPDFFFTNAEGKPNTKEQQLERLRSHIEAVAAGIKAVLMPGML
ncbi:GH35 family endo-1,4-beta-xylanase [Mucilaginibacter sp. HD30]